jgi:hemerythrin superfamily protein
MHNALSKNLDAVDLLDADHITVKNLFDQYNKLAESGGPAKERKTLADRISFELAVHTQLEEEGFYPLVRKATGAEDIMNEADVEHEGAKKMIAEISAMDPQDSHYDARVKVLGEMINHHVAEERSKMFPRVRKSGLNLVALGAQLKELKAQIVGELSQALA